jgi:hypothetical protein
VSGAGGDGAGGGWRRPPTADERLALLRGPGVSPGLCAGCLHLRLLSTGQARFVRCLLAETDAGYPRYPALPVLACAGHERWGRQE